MRRIEWLNANAYRRYPFTEDQDLSVSGGAITFTDDIILDFQGVSYLHEQCNFRLASFDIIGTVPRQGIFSFLYEGAPAVYNPVEFAVVESAVIPFTSISHISVAHYMSCIFGPGMPALLQNTPGHYTMTYLPTVESALMLFQPNHRVSNIVGGEVGSVDLNNGLVYTENGHNCRADVNLFRNALRINAIRGAGAGVDCEPAVEGITLCKDVLLLVNGLHGNDEGDYILAGENGAEIINEPDNHLIRVRANTTNPKACG